LVAALAAVVVFAAACGDDDDSSGKSAGQPTTAATQAPQVKRGGTLIATVSANPKVFDPMVYTDAYSGTVVSQVFETLVRYDKDVAPQPWLAEKWTQPDDVTYIFTLRKGVKFSDGTDLDAEAVRFSMERVRNFKSGPAYADSQNITDVVVVDPLTVKIVIKEANAPFINYLSTRLGTIVSPTAVKTMGDEKFGLNPVGTGPFKFKEFKSDAYVRLEKNANYWRTGVDGKPLPYLDGVELRVMTESTSRLTALQTGDVHVADVTDADLAIVKKDSNLVWKQQAGFSWGSFMLMDNKPPFDNKALRQALSYSIDRDEIIRVIFEGNREYGNGPIPPPHGWALDPTYKPYTLDLVKAKAKLAEGGKPDGFEFTGYFAAGDSLTQRLAELVQAQLAKANIKMKIEYGDFNGVVVAKARAGDPGLFGISFNCSTDPDPCVASWYWSKGGFNYQNYSNPAVDDLILQARRVSDREKRATLYKQVVKLIMDDAPTIFHTYGVVRFTGSKKVQGWTIGPALNSGYSDYWLSE
jgi:peptide/nickel transport system substrate-binding protein